MRKLGAARHRQTSEGNRGGGRVVAVAHGAYLLATGVWPLLHRASFEGVTGPKTDFWLVRVIGGLTALLGAALAAGALREAPPRELRLLALGSVPVYAAADVYAARRVSRVYLGDLVLQLLFAGAWARRTFAPSGRPASGGRRGTRAGRTA